MIDDVFKDLDRIYKILEHVQDDIIKNAYINKWQNDMKNKWYKAQAVCPECFGRGWINGDGISENCISCSGNGKDFYWNPGNKLSEEIEILKEIVEAARHLPSYRCFITKEYQTHSEDCACKEWERLDIAFDKLEKNKNENR